MELGHRGDMEGMANGDSEFEKDENVEQDRQVAAAVRSTKLTPCIHTPSESSASKCGRDGGSQENWLHLFRQALQTAETAAPGDDAGIHYHCGWESRETGRE